MVARTLTITVSYPRPALGANGRGHWASKARLVRDAREDAGWAGIEAMADVLPLTATSIRNGFGVPYFRDGAVRVDAVVRLGKGRKRMDEDGFWGCMKAALDGLTDAGVWRDDKQAVLGAVTYAGERVAGEGEVVLTLTGEA